MQQKFELISFDLCPFVQRSVITLLKKNVQHEITFIDLKNKPDWFLKISPLGKVPVLKTEGEILFESAVINEYLDEVTEGTLLPSDPLLKAKFRAWIEFSSNMLMTSYRFLNAKDEESFAQAKETLHHQLSKLEEQLPGGGFFNGADFSLVDAALAPVFTRLLLAEKRFGNLGTQDFPKITELAKNLAAQDYVKNSVISDFEKKFITGLETSGGFLTKL